MLYIASILKHKHVVHHSSLTKQLPAVGRSCQARPSNKQQLQTSSRLVHVQNLQNSLTCMPKKCGQAMKNQEALQKRTAMQKIIKKKRALQAGLPRKTKNHANKTAKNMPTKKTCHAKTCHAKTCHAKTCHAKTCSKAPVGCHVQTCTKPNKHVCQCYFFACLTPSTASCWKFLANLQQCFLQAHTPSSLGSKPCLVDA